MIQITIIGMGQIGASLGLALAGKPEALRRVGNDIDIKIARQAEKMGAVDRVEGNLPKAVREAEVVILALPVDQVRETLEIIAPYLKEGAVVMDTAPIKDAVENWTRQLLPEGRYYIGLTPAINPAYLIEEKSGLEAARDDLFQGGLMAIAAGAQTNAASVKLASDLAGLLGAMPFFIDGVEIDGIMAAVHQLPQLLSAALLNITVDQPGWREGRKMAGRAFAEGSGPMAHMDGAPGLSASAVLNQANVLRMLDAVIRELSEMRTAVAAQDQSGLEERLKQAQGGRVRWMHERQTSDWVSQEAPGIDIPEAGGMIGRLFGFNPKPRPKK